MNFARFSPEYVLDGVTGVDNLYISEYLPDIDPVINKVYLYGLFLCSSDTPDNTLKSVADRLGLDEAVVSDSFLYLQSMGLVRILNKTPFEVRYLPLKNAKRRDTRYDPEKYAEFNIRMQEILTGRMISVNEFREYYDLIETLKFEQETVLMIAKYAVDLKGDAIGYPYILAIARNWAREGVTTVEKAEERFLEYNNVNDRLAGIFKALGIRRKPDWEERELFLRWTDGMGFSYETVAFAAKSAKKGGMRRLDALLKRYYEAGLFSPSDISAYEKNKDELFELAKRINRTIGVYYEQLDSVVDSYIVVWRNMGFSDDALELIARVCFKRGIKTLEGLNEQVGKFYRQGLLTVPAIETHMERASESDAQIRAALSAAGEAERAITSRDRDAYRTWTYSWKLPDELVLYAASLASGAAQPVPYMNKILSGWHTAGVTTADEAKKLSASPFPSSAPPSSRPQTAAGKQNPAALVKREYTAEQLNALIDNIDDVEY